MRVIIFDLDLTLAATENCHAYLRTSTGRRDVVPALQAGTVSISYYWKELVDYVNSLNEVEDCCVAIASDSPKDYCLQVLSQCGYQIKDELVFGSQSKPLVNQDFISSEISRSFGVAVEDLSFLIVGDSPKDIYYAHSIAAASVFVSWGSKQSTMAHHAKPTCRADKFHDLESYIDDFLNGKLEYEPYDFKQDYLTISPSSKDFVRVELLESEVGFGKEYVKNREDHRNKHDLWASNELRWVVKQAKNLSKSEHEARQGTPLYGVNGLFQADPFKVKSGHFKNDFVRWCVKNNVTGNVLLVPVPPSVPRECNLTHSMSLMCGWWKGWINSEDHKINVQVHDAFERFWPKVPSHQTAGRRDMDEQFDTLGVFSGKKKKIENVNYVVIVDDVVTSGSHINAVASFIRTSDLVNKSANILGYALFKTIRVEVEENLDLSWLDAL